jgi:hypothetical protein
MRIITAITNANPALVTTSFDNSYVTGTVIRIDIPVGFGMRQLNQQFAPITVINSTQFTIPIDTTNYDAFVVPGGNTQYAQAVPLGELNGQLNAAVMNVLPYTAVP